MRILVAGGGTGGHVYPALAICQGLHRKYPTARFVYIGTRQGLESQIVPDHKWITFCPIQAAGWTKGSWARRLAVLVKLLVGLLQTACVFVWFRPQLVVGVGGYASFAPVMLAALLGKVLPLRSAIHEQNVIAGRANRWLSRYVDLVMLSFPQTQRSVPQAKRAVVTGNPIREEFLHAKRSDDAYRSFGLDPAKRTILVFGGSKGAMEMTRQVLDGRRQISANAALQILLVVGDPIAGERMRTLLRNEGIKNIVVFPYVHHMGTAFAVADLVVCRAGATSLAEITACGKASVLVPWREAAEDHQRANAAMLSADNACVTADQEGLVDRGLVGVILEQMDDELGLRRLSSNARLLGRRDAGALIEQEIDGLMRGIRL